MVIGTIIVAGAIGATIGSVAGGGIVKHSREVYQDKINELARLSKKLQTHIESLEKLKNEVPSFWDDDIVSTYLLRLRDKISEVRLAMEKVESAKITFEDVDADLAKTGETMKAIFDAATPLVNIGD